MRKRGMGVVIILLTIIAALLIWRVYFQEKGDGATLLLSGNMEVTEVNVGFKLAGRVIALAVEEGQQVRTGGLLARLDNAELATIVSQNRAMLQEALSRLAELKAGSRLQEVEEARANLRAQEAELARAKRDYERAEILHKNGAISAAQFDAAKSVYETKSAQQRSAAEVLSLVREGARKESIDAAVARVQQAQAAVSTAEHRLQDTEIHSPITGIVLKKNVELGETVGQGVPIYTIGDLSSPWIKVYVKEDKLGWVKIGQKAKVTTDSHPNKTYDAWVSYISSEAEFTPKSVQTQEERVKLVYGVKVRVDNADQELKPSMPADVRIAIK
jgi:HlyD family secretion protein